MRRAVGLGILALGVVALGWWGRAQYAPFLQDTVAAQARVVAATAVHDVTAQVSGRDIIVTGLVEDQAERARLLAGFDAVRGRRVVVDRLDILPVADPYSLDAVGVEGVLTLQGHAPSQSVRDLLATRGTGDLALASGAPDALWGDAALLGLAALAVFDEGTLTIRGRDLAFSGLLQTPEAEAPLRAALSALPEGYSASFDLRFADDGTPPAYTLTYAVVSGARVEGKRPSGVSAADLAAALGLDGIDDASTEARQGPAGEAPAVLGALAPWLAEVESLQVQVLPGSVLVEAGFGAGADMELLGAALGADLANAARGLTLRLREVVASGPEGALRRNQAAARDEVLSGGYWLPVPDFTPDRASCAAEVARVLDDRRIGFVTGSARLDARARSAVNALAGVLVPCLGAAGLGAEIGGHTDSTGSDEANLALSRARAEAVREALLARGLPAAQLAAQGYGASQPVADNATDEGRAANRRTEVRWIE